MQAIHQALNLLQEEKKKIVVTMHQRPDGDAMGSALALSILLRKAGHEVATISPNEWPPFLNWMPKLDRVINHATQTKLATDYVKDADLIFCLDFNQLYRVMGLGKSIAESKAKKILIDHHQEPNESEFDFGLSEPHRCATVELIYDFIHLCKLEHLIDDEVRQCIYTGLITDSGSFRFPATTASTLAIASEFLAQGLNHTRIYEQLFDNYRLERFHFLGYVFQHCLHVWPEKKVALIVISLEIFNRFQLSMGDTEGIVNMPLSIEGIQCSAVVLEKKDECKWSFRSKGAWNVHEFAKTNFNGGGHVNAAGGNSKKSLEENTEHFYRCLQIQSKSI